MNDELGTIKLLGAKVKLPIYLCVGWRLHRIKKRDE